MTRSRVGALENEVGGTWGQESIFHMLKDRTLFLVVIIGLSSNCVYSFIIRKIITSRSSVTLPVRVITEIMHFNTLLFVVVPWHRRLVFGDLDK